MLLHRACLVVLMQCGALARGGLTGDLKGDSRHASVHQISFLYDCVIFSSSVNISGDCFTSRTACMHEMLSSVACTQTARLFLV